VFCFCLLDFLPNPFSSDNCLSFFTCDSSRLVSCPYRDGWKCRYRRNMLQLKSIQLVGPCEFHTEANIIVQDLYIWCPRKFVPCSSKFAKYWAPPLPPRSGMSPRVIISQLKLIMGEHCCGWT
jgi:hypothetical protein